MDTYILSIRSIYDVWQVFDIDEGVACWLIVNNSPVFINTGFCSSSQDCVSHMHYVGIEFVAQEKFLDFIYDGLHIQDFLWWGLENHETRIWDIIPSFGGDANHETAWCIINIQQYFLLYSSIRGIVPIFSLFHIPECFWILFDICLCGAFIVYLIVNFHTTTITSDVVKVYLGFLFILFCFTFIIPSFPTLCKHQLVDDTLRLGLTIRDIIRLVI